MFIPTLTALWQYSTCRNRAERTTSPLIAMIFRSQVSRSLSTFGIGLITLTETTCHCHYCSKPIYEISRKSISKWRSPAIVNIVGSHIERQKYTVGKCVAIYELWLRYLKPQPIYYDLKIVSIVLLSLNFTLSSQKLKFLTFVILNICAKFHKNRFCTFREITKASLMNESRTSQQSNQPTNQQTRVITIPSW